MLEVDSVYGAHEYKDESRGYESQEKLADSLRLIIKGHGDRKPASELISKLLEHTIECDYPVDSEVEEFFSDHLHVGAFRNPPPFEITRRKLPPDPKWKPWRILLYDKDDKRFTTPSPLKRLNDGLECLRDIPYTAARRKRQELAFPIDLRGEPIKTEDTELVFLDNNNVPHPIQSLGSGVGVVLPVVIALTSATESFLTIEEPECHAHPGLQTQMGDLLLVRMNQRFPYTPPPGSPADRAAENWDEQPTRASSMLIETHSEHLILRILRRIRETSEQDFADWPDALRKACPNGIRPEDVAVLYVEPGEDGRKSLNCQ